MWLGILPTPPADRLRARKYIEAFFSSEISPVEYNPPESRRNVTLPRRMRWAARVQGQMQADGQELPHLVQTPKRETVSFVCGGVHPLGSD